MREQTENGGILVDVRNLRMWFPARDSPVKAVDDVSFAIKQGETVGLVGESGSGKTTVGRCILQLNRPTSGGVFYKGGDICLLPREELRRLRREMQIIFQDPFASLNPRMHVEAIVGDPLRVHEPTLNARARRERVAELLSVVGLDLAMLPRYPHQFSGGQRQRIGIARALTVRPEFIVCDEPVSALDVSIQAQIVNLLANLQTRSGLTYLFIAHDLAVVRQISHRIAVMYLGKVVETAPGADIYSSPLHPYTEALLSAVPVPDPEIEKGRKRILIEGEIPDPRSRPAGCVFHPRCPKATEECRGELPALREKAPDHFVACHRA